MVTDPISDMFIRIKNGYTAGKETVPIPYSKLKMEIAKVLQSEGYIKDIVRRGRKVKKNLEVILSYKNNEPAIKKIKRISKSSRRVYTSYKELFPVGSGYGIRILSTPKGILTDKKARKEKVGGEIIVEIW